MSREHPEEVRLELLVQPEDLDSLWQHPSVAELTRGPDSVQRLESVYFDTEDLDLARAGLALRLSRAGAATVQAVEVREGEPAGRLRCGDSEATVTGGVPDLEQIPDPELRARIETAAAGQPLVPMLRTLVRRSSRIVGTADWEARFHLDAGEAKTPMGSLPICELVLEGVRGDPAALYDLALELHADIALRPVHRGPVECSLAALRGESPEPRRASRLELATDAKLEDVLCEIFRSCTEQIIANEAPVRADAGPEGVHQLRVGCRRLRSALSLFGDTLPREDCEFLRGELRWLSGELGEARDLDVFLSESIEPMLRDAPDRDELQRLSQAVRQMREAAHHRAIAALSSRRYARLILSLGAFRAGCRWRHQPITPEAARLFAPAREVGRELLDRLHAKALRRGADLGDLAPEELHRLRIALKRLRYASEFLGGLYPHRHSKRFGKRLGRLQDTLGQLNDQKTARALLERVAASEAPGPTPSAHAWAIGFVSGWTSRKVREKLRPLEDEWRSFAKQRPFWRAG